MRVKRVQKHETRINSCQTTTKNVKFVMTFTWKRYIQLSRLLIVILIRQDFSRNDKRKVVQLFVPNLFTHEPVYITCNLRKKQSSCQPKSPAIGFHQNECLSLVHLCEGVFLSCFQPFKTTQYQSNQCYSEMKTEKIRLRTVQ